MNTFVDLPVIQCKIGDKKVNAGMYVFKFIYLPELNNRIL